MASKNIIFFALASVVVLGIAIADPDYHPFDPCDLDPDTPGCTAVVKNNDKVDPKEPNLPTVPCTCRVWTEPQDDTCGSTPPGQYSNIKDCGNPSTSWEKFTYKKYECREKAGGGTECTDVVIETGDLPTLIPIKRLKNPTPCGAPQGCDEQ
ncbi:MAG TPA: hypothetical protein VF777_10735 [Phycisphaerales bacterium]